MKKKIWKIIVKMLKLDIKNKFGKERYLILNIG